MGRGTREAKLLGASMADSRGQGGSPKGLASGSMYPWGQLRDCSGVVLDAIQRPGCMLKVMRKKPQRRGFPRQKLKGWRFRGRTARESK